MAQAIIVATDYPKSISRVWSSNDPTTYASNHDNANGTSLIDGIIGQYRYTPDSPDTWSIGRFSIFFDLSSLSAPGIVVTSVILRLASDGILPATHFDVVLLEGIGLADPQVVGDYGDLLTQTTSIGSRNTSDWPEDYGDPFDITLDAGGIALVQTALGTTIFFGIRSSRDIDSITPTGIEAIYPQNDFYNLIINYTLTGFIPWAVVI